MAAFIVRGSGVISRLVELGVSVYIGGVLRDDRYGVSETLLQLSYGDCILGNWWWTRGDLISGGSREN